MRNRGGDGRGGGGDDDSAPALCVAPIVELKIVASPSVRTASLVYGAQVAAASHAWTCTLRRQGFRRVGDDLAGGAALTSAVHVLAPPPWHACGAAADLRAAPAAAAERSPPISALRVCAEVAEIAPGRPRPRGLHAAGVGDDS